jgi:hypothetical protein
MDASPDIGSKEHENPASATYILDQKDCTLGV